MCFECKTLNIRKERGRTTGKTMTLLSTVMVLFLWYTIPATITVFSYRYTGFTARLLRGKDLFATGKNRPRNKNKT
ncbi:hypothetical protein FF18_07310 [Elizabethkingia anophelis]|uniref:Uncharacterized protein n=1 Tax=Elizabethkingia anophelis TaxID=1117645 RepID=A0AAU8UY54_9FLAO|nr:hypothetical protein BBD32_15545 [Elizabethkingia anophelis]EQB93819.1 hypothetical protein C874_03545 [Elizabethkingia anophelis 502]KFC34486.1 hypothetical protein FF18_07310 [Elizabethkingia anophelis]OPB56871.1 hypothetical protein BAY11_12635 [Elizabethkingia anophelis]OPB60266.1 hypothetical protein BAS07_12105 [Elizabethkingia anophelis]